MSIQIDDCDREAKFELFFSFLLLQILREAQIQNKTEDRFSTEDGRKEENIKKNRYKDILPRKIIVLF